MWTRQRTDAGAPYAVDEDQWVGYDDADSIQEKVQLVKGAGYGGAMVYSVDMDDFGNLCCSEPFPLLRSVARTLGLRTDARPTSDDCTSPSKPVTPPPPTFPPPPEGG